MAATLMASSLSSSIAAGVAQRPAAAGRASVRTSAFFRPSYGYRQQRRCSPKGSCGPRGGMSFTGGPMGFSSRTLTQDDIDNMMRTAEQFWRSMSSSDGWSGSNKWSDPAAKGDMPLAVDVQEEANAFVFTADVPGVSRSDVKVQARKDERELVISGERPAPELTEEQQSFRRRTERRFGKFSRTFSLPENAQLTGITAKFDNGVLTVTVPKTIPAEPEVTDVPISSVDDDNIRAIDV